MCTFGKSPHPCHTETKLNTGIQRSYLEKHVISTDTVSCMRAGSGRARSATTVHHPNGVLALEKGGEGNAVVIRPGHIDDL